MRCVLLHLAHIRVVGSVLEYFSCLLDWQREDPLVFTQMSFLEFVLSLGEALHLLLLHINLLLHGQLRHHARLLIFVQLQNLLLLLRD